MRSQILFAILIAANLQAQPPGPPQPPRPAKAAAPVDLTGYWVSVISEDWRWRMVTPIKGDFASIPINAGARRVGDAWDPAKDEAAGLQCKAFGAPAIMRAPGRVHITWQDDNTLKLETDEGAQTRVFNFAPPGSQGLIRLDGEPTWQGFSVANWERAPRGVEIPDPVPIFSVRQGGQGRSLEVFTTHLRPGYLRKNGVPYSANAIVTEWFDRHVASNGDVWLVVNTEVKDPQYLTTPFITSSHFKKLPDNAPWKPEACTSR